MWDGGSQIGTISVPPCGKYLDLKGSQKLKWASLSSYCLNL